MDDLVTFIEARLAEDEQVAREALHSDAVRPGEWIAEHHNSEHHSEPNRCHIAEDRSGHYWTVASEVFIPNAEHIARHDPARVLREVEAKRKAIESHRWHGPDGCVEDAFCPLLTAMATVWRDHPDFRAAWLTEADHG